MSDLFRTVKKLPLGLAASVTMITTLVSPSVSSNFFHASASALLQWLSRICTTDLESWKSQTTTWQPGKIPLALWPPLYPLGFHVITDHQSARLISGATSYHLACPDASGTLATWYWASTRLPSHIFHIPALSFLSPYITAAKNSIQQCAGQNS